MRRPSVALTLLLAIIAPAAPVTASGQDGPGDDEMAAIADRFDRAQIGKDAAMLDAMVDPALIFIEGSGGRSDKAGFIAGWMGAGDRFDPVVLHDRRFTALGRDAFVVTAETSLTGSSDGTRFVSRIRFSDTFRRDPASGGGWRAIHIQVTRMAPAAATDGNP